MLKKEKYEISFDKIIDYYDQMKYVRQNKSYLFDEDPFSEGGHTIAFETHEAMSLMKVSQTRPQVKCMNITYDDLYYTITKNLSDDGGEN